MAYMPTCGLCSGLFGFPPLLTLWTRQPASNNKGNENMNIKHVLLITTATMLTLATPATAGSSYEECKLAGDGIKSITRLKTKGYSDEQVFTLYMDVVKRDNNMSLFKVRTAIQMIDWVYDKKKSSLNWMSECMGD